MTTHTSSTTPLTVPVAIAALTTLFCTATLTHAQHADSAHPAHPSADRPEDLGHGEAEASHAHQLEIGVAPGLVYVVGEAEFTFGLHAHLVANLGHSAWGLGLGFERLFDEHAHNTASLVLQYRIIDPWSVIVAPGLTFEDDAPSAVQPSAHIETAYEFAFGDVHLGPSLELALDPEDVHLTLGVHVGLGI